MAKGIYKRGDVYWLRYAGLDGRIIRESSHSSKLKEANDLLIGRRNEIKEGKQPDIKKRIVNHTFRELAEQYSKLMELQRSFSTKKCFVKQFVQKFGVTPLRNFNSMLLEQYQTEKLQEGNKPATVNRLFSVLKHMFTKAVEWEWIEEGVLKKIRKIKHLDEHNKRLRYLTVEQCEDLLNTCDSHLRPIVTCALHTGMRRSEILSLTWDKIDFNNGFILLDDSKNGERREIPMDQTLKETLLALFHGTKERPRRLDVNHVFYDPATEKTCKDIKRVFPIVCRRAKITDFHFHDLRHTFASHLVMSGQDITTVKELLGHKTLTMTLRYAHLAPSHKVKAVNVLDSVLTGKSTAQKKHNLESVSNDRN